MPCWLRLESIITLVTTLNWVQPAASTSGCLSLASLIQVTRTSFAPCLQNSSLLSHNNRKKIAVKCEINDVSWNQGFLLCPPHAAKQTRVVFNILSKNGCLELPEFSCYTILGSVGKVVVAVILSMFVLCQGCTPSPPHPPGNATGLDSSSNKCVKILCLWVTFGNSIALVINFFQQTAGCHGEMRLLI